MRQHTAADHFSPALRHNATRAVKSFVAACDSLRQLQASCKACGDSPGMGDITVSAGPSGKVKCWNGSVRVDCPPGGPAFLPGSPGASAPGTGASPTVTAGGGIIPGGSLLPPASTVGLAPVPAAASTSLIPGLSNSTLYLIGGGLLLFVLIKHK